MFNGQQPHFRQGSLVGYINETRPNGKMDHSLLDEISLFAHSEILKL